MRASPYIKDLDLKFNETESFKLRDEVKESNECQTSEIDISKNKHVLLSSASQRTMVHQVSSYTCPIGTLEIPSYDLKIGHDYDKNLYFSINSGLATTSIVPGTDVLAPSSCNYDQNYQPISNFTKESINNANANLNLPQYNQTGTSNYELNLDPSLFNINQNSLGLVEVDDTAGHLNDFEYIVKEASKIDSMQNNISGKRRISQEPRTCNKCGRTFKYPSDLKKHEQIHTDYKKFRCEDCGHTFRRLHQLKVHVRRHTGERPYVCTQCGMSFRHDSTLTMHTRTRHQHLKPFKCDDCKKLFGRLSHLRKHQKSGCATNRKRVSGELRDETNLHCFSSFVCNQCQEFFLDEAAYIQHEAVCLEKINPTGSECITNNEQGYIYGSTASPNSHTNCLICNITFSTIFEYQQHLLTAHSGNTFMSIPQSSHDSGFQNDHFNIYPHRSSERGGNHGSSITKFSYSSIFENQNEFMDTNYNDSNQNICFDVTKEFLNTPNNNNESKKSAEDIESLIDEPPYITESRFSNRNDT